MALADRPGHPERVRFLEVLSFAETMASLIEQLNMNHLFLRAPAKPSPAVVKLNTLRLKATLGGAGRDGGRATGCCRRGFRRLTRWRGFNLFAAPYFVRMEAFPKLRAYWERLQARPRIPGRRRESRGRKRFYAQDFYEVPQDV